MENWNVITENLTTTWDLLWKPILVFLGALFLLRISGRKTIADMTIAHAVIMIGLGSLLIQPIASTSLLVTFICAFVLVLTMLIIDFIQLKINKTETVIKGKSKVIIENGKLIEENLRKLKLTVDTLEMKLRQKGISKISDVEWATLEVSGNLGYKLKSSKEPATIEEIEKLIDLKLSQFVNATYKSEKKGKTLKYNQGILIEDIEQMIDSKVSQAIKYNLTSTIPINQSLFTEVAHNEHESHPPERLH